jgi:hypothetical protein
VREKFGGLINAGESLVLSLGALLLVAVPHSTRCRSATGHFTICGSGIPWEAAVALACAIGLFALAIALMIGARWARGLAFTADVVLAVAAIAALGASFAGSSPDDRSTYGFLWVLGALPVVPLLVAIGLLWPRRGALRS